MDVFWIEPVLRNRLGRLRLADLLGSEARPLEHVEELGVASGSQLASTVELDSAILQQACEHAVGDAHSELRLEVVTDDRNPSLFETLMAGLLGTKLEKKTPEAWLTARDLRSVQ